MYVFYIYVYNSNSNNTTTTPTPHKYRKKLLSNCRPWLSSFVSGKGPVMSMAILSSGTPVEAGFHLFIQFSYSRVSPGR